MVKNFGDQDQELSFSTQWAESCRSPHPQSKMGNLKKAHAQGRAPILFGVHPQRRSAVSPTCKMPSHSISQKQDIKAVKSGRLLKLDLSLLQSRSGLSSQPVHLTYPIVGT
jgi:hypothetical protein